MEILQKLRARARQDPQRIVLFEGEEELSLIAAEIIEREKLAKLTLLGNVDKIQTRLRTLGITLGSSALLDPAGSGKLKPYAQRLYERRRSRGMTEPEALQTARLPRIFADLMVAAGDADGSVGGALTTTADTVRAALWTLGLAPGFSLVSSFFLMVSPQKNIGADGACLFADCAVVPQPSPAQLAEIALATAENARASRSRTASGHAVVFYQGERRPPPGGGGPGSRQDPPRAGAPPDCGRRASARCRRGPRDRGAKLRGRR